MNANTKTIKFEDLDMSKIVDQGATVRKVVKRVHAEPVPSAPVTQATNAGSARARTSRQRAKQQPLRNWQTRLIATPKPPALQFREV